LVFHLDNIKFLFHQSIKFIFHIRYFLFLQLFYLFDFYFFWLYSLLFLFIFHLFSLFLQKYFILFFCLDHPLSNFSFSLFWIFLLSFLLIWYSLLNQIIRFHLKNFQLILFFLSFFLKLFSTTNVYRSLTTHRTFILTLICYSDIVNCSSLLSFRFSDWLIVLILIFVELNFRFILLLYFILMPLIFTLLLHSLNLLFIFLIFLIFSFFLWGLIFYFIATFPSLLFNRILINLIWFVTLNLFNTNFLIFYLKCIFLILLKYISIFFFFFRKSFHITNSNVLWRCLLPF